MTVPAGTGALETTQQQVLTQLQAGTGGGTVTIADGANVAQGTTTDVAWTSGAGTEIALLKKLVAQLATTLGVSGTVTANAGTNLNTSSLALETGGNLASIVTNTAGLATQTTLAAIKTDADSISTNTSTTATNTSTIATNTTGLATQTTLSAAKTDLDTIVTQTLTPNVSDRWARQVGQVDLARVNGAALSQSNPVIVEDSIRNWIRNGNGFVYFNTSGSVTATNGALTVCGLSIFNPANSGKNILIYRISVASNSGSSVGIQLRQTTTDPSGGTGFTGTGTASNLKPGGGNTVASLCASATGITASPTLPGTAWGTYGLTGNAPNDVLTPGSALLLPSGSTAYGLAVMIFVNTAGNAFTCTVHGIEY